MDRNRLYVCRSHPQPMVRLCPGIRQRALDRVEPAHVARIGIAARGEIARIACHAGESSVEEIRVERNDYISRVELVRRLNRLTEGHTRTFIHVVTINRLPEMPLRLRETLEHRLHLLDKRRRGKIA